MRRRTFLSVLGTLAGGMMFDPERALWIPGQKKIFDLGQHIHRELDRFRVVFPDGTEYLFDGSFVNTVSEAVGEYITSTISIVPDGPIKVKPSKHYRHNR